jgi:hypothetical protein
MASSDPLPANADNKRSTRTGRPKISQACSNR